MKVYRRDGVRLLGELPVANLKGSTLCYPSMVIKKNKYFTSIICFEVRNVNNEQVLIAYKDSHFKRIKRIREVV